MIYPFNSNGRAFPIRPINSKRSMSLMPHSFSLGKLVTTGVRPCSITWCSVAIAPKNDRRVLSLFDSPVCLARARFVLTLVNSTSDLEEKSRYFVKIRAKNNLGFSNFSTNFIVVTLESPLHADEFPVIQRAYYAVDGHRLRVQLSPIRSPLLTRDQLCIQHYHTPSARIEIHRDLPPCVALASFQSTGTELELPTVEAEGNIRLKICLINQTDVCSKSTAIPTGVALTGDSSDLILILIGKYTSTNRPETSTSPVL